MPWQGKNDASRQSYKYQYHPSGNPKNAPKDAPSALNSVIIPQVNLPKVGFPPSDECGEMGSQMNLGHLLLCSLFFAISG
jgi:hypothetical protein